MLRAARAIVRIDCKDDTKTWVDARRGGNEGRSGAICGEACGSIVVREIVAAVGTVQIGQANVLVANAAVGRDPIGALRTIIDITVHFGATAGALGKYRLPQKKIQHRTNATLQHNTQENPEPFAHVTARRILTDVPDHQHIDRNKRAPGRTKIDVHWKRAMVVSVENKKEKVLDTDEGHERQNN